MLMSITHIPNPAHTCRRYMYVYIHVHVYIHAHAHADLGPVGVVSFGAGHFEEHDRRQYEGNEAPCSGPSQTQNGLNWNGIGNRTLQLGNWRTLTFRNQDGHCQCGANDEGSDGYKPILRDWFLDMELQRLAGEEQGIDTHTTWKDHEGKTDHHRQGKGWRKNKVT